MSTLLDWSGRKGAPLATVGDLRPCIHCEEARIDRVAAEAGDGK